MKFKIFISSVQKEFKKERSSLKDYIYSDALLSKFFDVFLFEDLPALDRRSDEVYLEEVKYCDIYLGLFGEEYGAVDHDEKSATHREFLLATEIGKPRFIFVKGDNDTARHPRMLELLKLAGEQLIRRRFSTQPELNYEVYASLVRYLFDSGRILTGPFDATICRNAQIEDISEDKIRWFLARAHNERNYNLAETTPVVNALTHLNLLEQGKPNHAAILLFGLKPQRFLITSEVKCLHFHGTQKLKPIPSYQIYKGTLFDLVDQSIDFVMSKLNRSVGTRAHGPQVPVEYDIPEEVVAEGIVNAVAHRNYTSNASVEIMLFSDRLEIWNPGTLPPSLTIESLRKTHSSYPSNPLIAEPLFLAKYIEKVGTGTVDMYDWCQKAGMKPPEFKLDNGSFILTVWRKRTSGNPESPIKSGPSRDQVGTKSGLSPEEVIPILSFCSSAKAISDIQKQFKWTNRTKFRNKYVNPLLQDGSLEMTIPEKPNSRLQKYRLTKKGADYLKKHRK
jgi:predicted HTH transcriptional regulator